MVAVAAAVVEHFVMIDFYYYYCFHLNDSMMRMIEVRHMVVVVEKNYFEMMIDYYRMIDHNVLALNHTDEVHEPNY